MLSLQGLISMPTIPALPPLFTPTDSIQDSPPPYTPPDQLTPMQEQDLLLVPEALHAKIARVLAQAPLDGWTHIPITTVQAALVYLQGHNEIPITQPITLAEEELVKALLSKGLPASVVAAQEEGPQPTVVKESKAPTEAQLQRSARAQTWKAYIAACQARKVRMADLKEEIRHAVPLPNPEFTAWARQQRAQCEEYIEAHRPLDAATLLRNELRELEDNPLLWDGFK
jgi:hypothetical protein